MKNISAALRTFLNNASEMDRADLLTINLPNGQNIYAVVGYQSDITYNSILYRASLNGTWQRGTVTSTADFRLGSESCALSVIADTNVLVPGTQTSLMSIIQSGFFDAAPVNLTTVFMPKGQPQNIIGSLTLFSGMIASVTKVGRSKAEFDCKDWLFLLNLKVPIRVIQPSCHHTLFDAGCALSQSAYAIANSVAAGSSQVIIIPNSNWPTSDPNSQNPQVPPYFVQGKIQFTSGQNKNLWGYVVAQQSGSAGELALAKAMIFPVATGDTFNAYAGCDKTITTCISKFNNKIHFDGAPFCPPPESSA
jgi:uncharacterized phage protein (TIGR02218 family)